MNRNIAVLVLDSVRKDFFNEYAERIQNKSSLSVHRAYAPSSWSTPSHASMFTGKLPFQHGIHTYHRSFDDLQQEEIFHTQLSDYSTLGVSANVFAGSTYGFDKFFDSFTDVSPAQRFPSGLDPTEFEDEYLQYAISALLEPNTFSSTLLWRRLLVDHSTVSRMVFSASFPGFLRTPRRS